MRIWRKRYLILIPVDSRWSPPAPEGHDTKTGVVHMAHVFSGGILTLTESCSQCRNRLVWTNTHTFLYKVFNSWCRTRHLSSVNILLWLNYIAGLGYRYTLGLGFQTRWLHCTVQYMFTLHKLGLGSLLPFSTYKSEYESIPESESGNVSV